MKIALLNVLDNVSRAAPQDIQYLLVHGHRVLGPLRIIFSSQKLPILSEKYFSELPLNEFTRMLPIP
jgi:hypothetical protein